MPQKYVIVVVNNSRWLAGYDPYGDPPGAMAYRTGKAQFTEHIEKALHFDSPADALTFWKQVHPTTPVRPDGRPNRPLTAYTIEVMRR